MFDAEQTGSEPWHQELRRNVRRPCACAKPDQIEEPGLDPHIAVHHPQYAQDYLTKFGFDATNIRLT